MAAPVTFTLTAEQAEILGPLIQQMTSSSSSTQSASPHCVTDYSSPCGSDNGNYSTDELLSKKGKNSISSPAQKYLAVSIN